MQELLIGIAIGIAIGIFVWNYFHTTHAVELAAIKGKVSALEGVFKPAPAPVIVAAAPSPPVPLPSALGPVPPVQ